MAEWLKAAVLKTVVRKYRGFESYSLRQSPQQPTRRDDRVGRWCSPAKRVWGLCSTEGSNPSLSAIYRPRTRNVSGVFLCAPIFKDGDGSTPTVPSAALHTHPITLPPHPGPTPQGHGATGHARAPSTSIVVLLAKVVKKATFSDKKSQNCDCTL
jgi:hypothetical protein